jgi:hypothetical protein
MKEDNFELMKELEEEVSPYYKDAQEYMDNHLNNYRGVFYKRNIDRYGVTVDGVKMLVKHTTTLCPTTNNTLLFATALAMLMQEIYNHDKKFDKPDYLAWAEHYGFLEYKAKPLKQKQSSNQPISSQMLIAQAFRKMYSNSK